MVSPPAPEVQAPTLDTVYAAVAARRTQFDDLVWQVPVVSLTAQAFLFTISLASDTSQFARTVSCCLSIVVTFLTLHLFTRHRQAEITDAHWLEAIEAGTAIPGAHGQALRRARALESGDAWIFSRLSRLPGYRTWSVGLSIFGVAAALILIVTWVAPSWLTTGNI